MLLGYPTGQTVVTYVTSCPLLERYLIAAVPQPQIPAREGPARHVAQLRVPSFPLQLLLSEHELDVTTGPDVSVYQIATAVRWFPSFCERQYDLQLRTD
jgi:hypothetical protein